MHTHNKQKEGIAIKQTKIANKQRKYFEVETEVVRITESEGEIGKEGRKKAS